MSNKEKGAREIATLCIRVSLHNTSPYEHGPGLEYTICYTADLSALLPQLTLRTKDHLKGQPGQKHSLT